MNAMKKDLEMNGSAPAVEAGMCGGDKKDGPRSVVVKEEEGQGRYLVAGRDIVDGDTILEEYPLVAGPLYTRSRPVCLGCLKLVGPDSPRCSSCGFPLCSRACETSKLHRAECKVLSGSGFELEVEDWTRFCPVYSCITILRALLLQDTNPEGWSILTSLMDHEEDRQRKDSPTWKVHELLVNNFVRGALKLDQFTPQIIRRVIGILRTNSVKLESRAGHGEGIAVYPTYSFANHSCICNTHTRKFKDLKLQLISQAQISKGEIVWTRYTTPQLGNYQRIQDIQRTWHFTCSCSRCSDPTEFGTMMSGIICRKEDCQGVLLPIHPNMLGSPWCCLTCKGKVGVVTVQKVIKEVTDDIARHREEDNDTLLNLIQKYSDSMLHGNHYLLVGVKEVVLQRLMAWVADKPGLAARTPADQAAIIKLRTQLFREIVAVLRLVDSPGAPWTQKLQKMEAEEADLLAKL